MYYIDYQTKKNIILLHKHLSQGEMRMLNVVFINDPSNKYIVITKTHYQEKTPRWYDFVPPHLFPIASKFLFGYNKFIQSRVLQLESES